MKEIWMDIVGYKGYYQISNFGKVKSVDRTISKKNKSGNISFYKLKGRIITPNINNRGYYIVRLYKNGKGEQFLISRLVAQAFISNPKNLPEVNHIDENKSNNRIDNLEWCSRIYNNKYGKQSTENRIKNSRKRMRRVAQYTKNEILIEIFDGVRVAERRTKINNSNIIKSCKGIEKFAGGYMWRYYDD